MDILDDKARTERMKKILEIISTISSGMVSDKALDEMLAISRKSRPNGDITIDDLYAGKRISARACNVLRHAGITTLYDLSKLTIRQMQDLRNNGPKALKEMLAALSVYGLAPAEEKEDANG